MKIIYFYFLFFIFYFFGFVFFQESDFIIPFNACIAEEMTVSILEWASEAKLTKCVRTFWVSRMVSQASIK